jgi:CBS domain containing-hemolysin-like protein
MRDAPVNEAANAATADEPSLFQSLWNRLRATLGARGGEDLRDAIEEMIEEEARGDAPTIEAGERFLLRNILELHEKMVEDVMVPRVDITAIEVGTSLDDVIRLMSEKAHSRLPVYRGTLDDVIGMIHIKDVLPRSRGNGDVKLQQILREAIFAAPSMPVLDLLAQMRDTRIHLALVIDEFGGVDGLVTIEDLVEEIVGEIEDEHDEERPRMFEERTGVVLADARARLDEFEQRFGAVFSDEENDDIETLGGLVFSLAGRVPGRGELVTHPSGIEFEIVDADPRRIHRLRVRKIPASAGDET